MVERPVEDDAESAALSWRNVDGRLLDIGAHDGGFSFDNEGPRHTTYVQPFRIAERAVANADWLAFMLDGGYDRPELWLSDGWHTVQARRWRAPDYWQQRDGSWECSRLWRAAGPPGRARLPRLVLRGFGIRN